MGIDKFSKQILSRIGPSAKLVPTHLEWIEEDERV